MLSPAKAAALGVWNAKKAASIGSIAPLLAALLMASSFTSLGVRFAIVCSFLGRLSQAERNERKLGGSVWIIFTTSCCSVTGDSKFLSSSAKFVYTAT